MRSFNPSKYPDNMLKRFYKSLFFSRRFYGLLVAVIFLFVLSYGVPFLFVIAQLGTLFLAVAALLDYVVLFPRSNPVTVRRECPERFSNGDLNPVKLVVSNLYPFQVSLRI